MHTTCASYRVKELKAVAERKLNTALSDMHMLPKACDRVPSPSLLDREYDKSSKYGRLVMIAAKQHLDGKRSTLPTFVPFVVSDFGELAPAAIDLQEWIVNQYRVRCLRLGRRADGCSTDDLVRNFRHRFKIGVQMAIATGLGAMIQGSHGVALATKLSLFPCEQSVCYWPCSPLFNKCCAPWEVVCKICKFSFCWVFRCL